ncbi:HU family DNA-binding protein, partial [Borreliella garinii]
MEKKELMKLVSEKTNFYLEHVELVFDAIFEEIKYQNKQEKSVNIKEI